MTPSDNAINANNLHCENKPTEPIVGYTTHEALSRLADEIRHVVEVHELKFKSHSFLAITKSAFAKSYESPLSWVSIVTTILVIICLASLKHYFTALWIFSILLATIALVVYESYLRRTEMFRKVRLVLHEIEVAKQLCGHWSSENYPNIRSPLSPCVTLQLTYRDGQLVNLPWALLVKGDAIVIRPGQISPTECTEIDGQNKFQCGETYGSSQPLDTPCKPTVRTPLPDIVCTLDKTPYLDNLEIILEKSFKRPATIYNQQRHMLIDKYIQQWGVLICLTTTLFFAALHYNDKLYDDRLIELKWMNLFLELPICAILPVIPMMFPVMWIAINLWGVARLETYLAQPQTHTKYEQQKSFQEDLDTPTFECETIQLSFKEVFGTWIRLWKGYSMLLGRSSNIVQVLGSVTALCCVDKKGILSWPNPTAEKVFFLRDSEADDSSPESPALFDGVENSECNGLKRKSVCEAQATNSAVSDAKAAMAKRDSGRIVDTHRHPGTVAEVLDLTHDQYSPFRIDFDDHGWQAHVDSLKPLGLAILMNTCCQQTQDHYAKFCAHVTAVATNDKDLVPVVNRYNMMESCLNSFMHGRCLCELAKQIGFIDHARDAFKLEGQIASYMHLQPEVVKRDIRFARQLRIGSKVKVPFPHCLSVVMRDLQSNSLQMLTQGTADIVLDCCDDFWDGKDLRSLGPQERKRAQDFYQRNALTAYCTAFSYRPLRHGISGALGETAYMELPPESVYKTNTYRRDHDIGKGVFSTYDGSESSKRLSAPLPHSQSTDSLLFAENNREEDASDVDGCFDMQRHQVFIGMVTMQYQAQTDIVSLIERLERACIRFVHFSKENELRSRVFSEKMGLESGWNCHISLLSDEHSIATSPHNMSRNFDASNPDVANIDDESYELHKLLPRAMDLEKSKSVSSSAPSAVNEDMIRRTIPSKSTSAESEHRKHRISKDSAMEEENCRSLSGYTDSTEQSAPVNFDMSNRAKLPRGIKNIRPHLDNVDNVPLLVSLFTDCSAEATCEMLNIMQSYGEIVICIGSSASSANADTFLQADCSIAIEPLYPQVCQDLPAYTESNLLNNRHTLACNPADYEPTRFQHSETISPIYLSRQLNSLPCSIAVCRDDPITVLSMIELSRRFSNGLWNCIQFWVCCACTLSIINTICACLALPPILTPFTLVYLMCVLVPLIATTLVRSEADPDIMSRATAKKHSKLDTKAFAYVIFSYGCKFVPTIVIMVIAYCLMMSHPLNVFNMAMEDFYHNLDTSRCFILYSVVLHFIMISMSFVHRDYSIWQKSPFTNSSWLIVCNIILIVQTIVLILNLLLNPEIVEQLTTVWPLILFLLCSLLIVFGTAEFCKWQELKSNIRYQRRARLDFGTKLGMNSPF